MSHMGDGQSFDRSRAGQKCDQLSALKTNGRRLVTAGLSRAGKGEFSRARKVWGPPSLKNAEKVFQMASFWPQICIKPIFGWGCALDPDGRDYELLRSPRPLVGWWGDTPPHVSFFSTLLTPSASRSRHIQNQVGCDKAPRDGFPGSAVALDGPAWRRMTSWRPPISNWSERERS